MGERVYIDRFVFHYSASKDFFSQIKGFTVTQILNTLSEKERRTWQSPVSEISPLPTLLGLDVSWKPCHMSQMGLLVNKLASTISHQQFFAFVCFAFVCSCLSDHHTASTVSFRYPVPSEQPCLQLCANRSNVPKQNQTKKIWCCLRVKKQRQWKKQ